MYGTYKQPVCRQHTSTTSPVPTLASDLQYNIIYIAIIEIIILIAYYSTHITKEQQLLYDNLVLKRDTVTSIYSVCTEENTKQYCKVPYDCQKTTNDIVRRICRHNGILTTIFGDTKRKELFFIGYNILTTQKWTTSSLLTGAIDKLLTMFVSKQSLVEALVGLADVVIDSEPVEWDALSTVYKFLSGMKHYSTSRYNYIMNTLINENIKVYGLDISI